MTMAAGLIAAPGALAGTRWGTNKLSATAKATIFDSTFSAKETGAEGYPNPDSPQTAKTTSITAKKNNDALDRIGHAHNIHPGTTRIAAQAMGLSRRSAGRRAFSRTAPVAKHHTVDW